MVDDPKQPKRNRNTGNRGGIPPIVLLFLPQLIKLLRKRPKLLLVLVVIGGIYFFLNKPSSDQTVVTSPDAESAFSTGLNMSQEMYDKSQIYEPLSAYGNQLPARVSLEKYCPPRLNQGSQGSCVGWSSSYAARTILHSRATGQSPRDAAFSPSSLYNQIKLPNCQGAYIHTAMDVMHKRGVLPFKDFKYDQNDCSRTPSGTLMTKASQFRTRGFERLWENEGGTDIDAIKQNIAQGAPVVVGMLVGGSFMNAMQGRKMWRPTSRDRQMRGFGGHAMCIMGYDDNMEGGAFQIMNSWGPNWGDRGFCWVRYSDFEYFTREAYGLHPMGDAQKQDPNKFAVSFGLVNNATGKPIPMEQSDRNVFSTRNSVTKGTRFKVMVSNSIECYTYILGQETDGSSYVLFPYTDKHSPYCGITGTRLFPRNQSLMADNIGSKDVIAVVVSKQEIDVQELNKLMNSTTGSFASRLNQILDQYQVRRIRYGTDNSAIHFNAQTDGQRSMVGIVLNIDKH
jgi:C1A family cysteine protease